MAILAEVTRADALESQHDGIAVVMDVTGKLVASVGDPSRLAFFRSSAKPYQAIPFVESGAADAFGFDEREVALASASHNASPDHQRLVAAMLAKIGLGDDDLRCGYSPPIDEEELARITLGMIPKTQIACECSGEHAGMLAACVHQGFPTESYTEPDHPLQRRIRAIIASALRMPADEIVIGVDGCSLPTFGAPLQAFALAYATLAAPERAPEGQGRELAPSINRMRTAILSYPEMISGEGAFDTDLMRLSEGRVLGKLGAEGLICLAIPERGLGVAIKSLDGMPRALGPASIAALEQLDVLDRQTLDELRKQHSAPVESFRGNPVGEIRPALQLTFAD